MPFDLTIKQCQAGPGHSQYIFTKDKDKAVLVVLDVTESLHLGDGAGAIVIGYQGALWLYVFRSNQYPPQEPKLLLNSSEALSIEGAGELVPLESLAIKEAIAEVERRLPEILAKLLA